MQSTPHVVCSRNDEFRWWQNDLERLHFRIRLDSSSFPHAPGPCPVPGPCNVSRLVRAQGPSLIPPDAGAAARPQAPETVRDERKKRMKVTHRQGRTLQRLTLQVHLLTDWLKSKFSSSENRSHGARLRLRRAGRLPGPTKISDRSPQPGKAVGPALKK